MHLLNITQSPRLWEKMMALHFVALDAMDVHRMQAALAVCLFEGRTRMHIENRGWHVRANQCGKMSCNLKKSRPCKLRST